MFWGRIGMTDERFFIIISLFYQLQKIDLHKGQKDNIRRLLATQLAFCLFMGWERKRNASFGAVFIF